MEGVIDQHGEGVILRKVNSLYEHGRSRALVKLKVRRRRGREGGSRRGRSGGRDN